ncbi:hypothetical protein BKA65DRAFT_555303 [Rhexocercosporidium sp. MPI-PUGE-AT-0058]|nr:hypothetical protein BKA65DRAFT_555303 [Rhexocercosporidium sp. MPI-PUGE-AT-0058]
MSWNSVVEFHQTIRGDGAEESYKVFNRWEEKEQVNSSHHRCQGAGRWQPPESRAENETIGLGGGGRGSLSKTKAKNVRKDENNAGIVAKEKRKDEARVDQENDNPKVTGKSGSSEFRKRLGKNPVQLNEYERVTAVNGAMDGIMLSRTLNNIIVFLWLFEVEGFILSFVDFLFTQIPAKFIKPR